MAKSKPNPILAWLEANNHNQKWLADKIGVNQSIVSRLIAGKAMPRWTTMLVIQELTGVGATEILTWQSEAPH